MGLWHMHLTCRLSQKKKKKKKKKKKIFPFALCFLLTIFPFLFFVKLDLVSPLRVDSLFPRNTTSFASFPFANLLTRFMAFIAFIAFIAFAMTRREVSKRELKAGL